MLAPLRRGTTEQVPVSKPAYARGWCGTDDTSPDGRPCAGVPRPRLMRRYEPGLTATSALLRFAMLGN